MELYTSRVSYVGAGRLDITIKSGDPVFSPSWDMVMGIKNGRIGVYEYTTQYYELMRMSWVNNRARWMEVLQSDRVVLCCYCGPRDFCHRHLLADILVKCARSLGIEITYGGEI